MPRSGQLHGPATMIAGDSPFEGARILPLEFHGNARDYFRVWVVNLCLTLCTAGIFSAWAKVRKQRYLHTHTVLDGTPFQYLGRPLAILRGRCVAVVFLGTYTLVSYFAPWLKPFVLAAAVVVAPWVIVRSAAFSARYCAFRNLRFNFTADYGNAVKALYWLGVIPALVVGMMFEWWDSPRIMALMFGVAGILFPFWLWRFKRFMITHSSYGDQRGVFEDRARSFFRIYLFGGLIIVIAGVVTGVLVKLLGESRSVMVYLASAPIFAGYMLSMAYVRAQSANTVWNHLRIGPLRFRSTLKTWPLFLLYASNTLCILISCGLLLPWAVIRTVCYRIANLQVESHGDLAQFRSGATRSADAAGAEISDIFQLDLAL